VLRIAIEGIKSGAPWANILHAAYTGSVPSVATLHAVATDIANLWAAHMQPRQTSDTSLETIKLTDLSSAMGAQVEDTHSITGTNGEDPLPSSVAALVDYPVALRYRGGHPRQYLVAGGDGDLFTLGLDWNQWNTAFLAALGTSWQNFTNGLSAISEAGTNLGELVAIRYLHDKAYLVPPIVLPLPSFTLSVLVASQRRRTGRKKA
jgi:hypothetical protein